MISWEDVKAAHRLRDYRVDRRARGALVDVLSLLAVAAAVLLAGMCYGVEGQAPDSLTLSVLWQRVDTFSTYDVELLRSVDCDEPPDSIQQSRYRVGDVDASFREPRPPAGSEWCYRGRARVWGTFDCTDPADGPDCFAPWGESPVLPIRTPNPPPGPPDVVIDTTTFVAAGGDPLAILRGTLPADYPADVFRLLAPDTVVLAHPGSSYEVCAYAGMCHGCEDGNNVHCPCYVETWAPVLAFEVESAGGRVEHVRAPAGVPDWGPSHPLYHWAPYALGLCVSVRRLT